MKREHKAVMCVFRLEENGSVSRRKKKDVVEHGIDVQAISTVD